MSEFCQDCPAKSQCESICPELELHLKEIEKTQRELLIANPRKSNIKWPSGFNLTKTEKQIATLLSKGFSRKDVCQMCNITRSNLRDHLKRMKKKYTE